MLKLFTIILVCVLVTSVNGVTLSFLKVTIPQETQLDTTLNGLRVNEITWVGLRSTSPKLLLREFQHNVGLPYSSKHVIEEKNRFSFYDHISYADVIVMKSSDGVSIQWNFKENPPLLLYPEWSYNDQENLSIGGTVMLPNLDGLGAKLSSSAIFGKNTRYEVEFEHPWITGSHIGLKTKFVYSFQENSLEDWREKFYESENWVSQWYQKSGRIGIGLGYIQTHLQPLPTRLTPIHTTDLRQFWIGNRIGIDLRNTLIGTNQGTFFEFEGRRQFGDTQFLECVFDLRTWHSFTNSLYVSQQGFLQLRNRYVGNGLPDYKILRLGGTNTIRGYQLDSLGRVVFGENEYISTTELRWRLLPKVQVESFQHIFRYSIEIAGFVDVGSAWSKKISHSKRVFGGGVGFRIVAPLFYETRVDFAIGEGGERSIHFGLQTKSYWHRKRLR